MPAAVLLLLVLAFVLLRRRDDEAPEGMIWPPSDPLVAQPLANNGPGPRAIPPNAHNTGSVNCVERPDICNAWACAQQDKSLKENQQNATVLMGLVGGGQGAAVGAAWGGAVSWATHTFGRSTCQGSPSVSFVGCDHSLPVGAPVTDSLGNPAGNCMGVKATPTQAELDRKYMGKRSGDHIVGAGSGTSTRRTK